MTQQLRYVGRVSSMPGNDGYGFISLETVEMEDGSAHNLETLKDIFVHQDDCSSKLRPGVMVIFDPVQAPNRPEGELRAMGASEYIEAELLPEETPVPGLIVAEKFSASREIALYKERLSVHQRMKHVPESTVHQVIANRVMENVPRGFGRNLDPSEEEALLQIFLQQIFPHMAEFNADFNILGANDDELEAKFQQASSDLVTLGMDSHVQEMKKDIDSFKSVRSALRMIFEERMVRPDTIIPIRYLPDLFMATPVWFFWADPQASAEARENWVAGDPKPHRSTVYMCDLFPGNRRWADTYQMFNRRTRTLSEYRGEGLDMIPPFVARRMKKAIELFDYVVITTPYLDLAGSDWKNLEWIKSIDPYLIGFKKGVPYFFILGRFSNTGIFPLMNELVGDTIEFLRTNQGLLANFNLAKDPYWYQGERQIHGYGCQPGLGTYLQQHASKLLDAFDQSRLFDWLRGGDPATEVVKQ